MNSTRLIIARHGNTFKSGDILRRLGSTDLPLVDTGLEQGRLLGLHLKQHGLIPDIIFTSKLQRTIQTAQQAQEAMQTHIPERHLSLFNEINYGPDENQPENLVQERIGKFALDAWEKEGVVPNGWQLNPEQLISNWQDFASSLLQDFSGQLILVVTSNGIARFAPYLTGDFQTFCDKFNIKLATGAFALFENTHKSAFWQCLQWNTKPLLE